ncbi:MAG: ribosome maturation factor RimP [Candidatus Omnitrophica bacterium]|jgi:ribosome maturation factor RimP|nr:ribosome maturation factor RimP [Candidatus Omnitrophota bacterium]MDD4981283.1 ribosome maturation factor RimP [Candidatus Omnitrophota bacterium]MDD5664570.1 ribosome maturation factor RimP [Candidatus Omnitrophota bacterium]
MGRDLLTEELDLSLRDYFRSAGFILVETILRYEGGVLVLRILADRPEGGINMDECAILNRDIGRFLDEKDIIRDRYILEVASPGLDRALRTKEDFSRFLNEKVRFFLNNPINGKIEWDGLIVRVEEESVFVNINGENVEVPFIKINKAKLII